MLKIARKIFSASLTVGAHVSVWSIPETRENPCGVVHSKVIELITDCFFYDAGREWGRRSLLRMISAHTPCC